MNNTNWDDDRGPMECNFCNEAIVTDKSVTRLLPIRDEYS